MKSLSRRAVFSALLTVAPLSIVHAEAGRTAGLTLRRMIAARPAGMGEAYTAIHDDIDTIYFNPAGIAKLSYSAITSSYQRGFAGDDYGSLGYGQPLPFGSLFVGGSYF